MSNKIDTKTQVTDKPSTESPVQDLAVNKPSGQLPLTIEEKQNSTPDGKNQRVTRRLIICCDGTWQDGLQTKAEDEYTNILRITRAIRQVSEANLVRLKGSDVVPSRQTP